MEEKWAAEESGVWGEAFLKTLLTAFVLIAVAVTLALLTVFLGWWKFILLCFLGLLTGMTLTAAVLSSPKIRELVLLLFSILILPSLAAYLGIVAAKNPTIFDAYTSSFLPFLVYAVGALFMGLSMARIWRRRPGLVKEEVSPGETAEASSQTMPFRKGEVPKDKAKAAAGAGEGD